jgi:hypothetical protein
MAQFPDTVNKTSTTISSSIPVMRKASNLIEECDAVPLHPKLMAEGGRVLAKIEGNRRCMEMHHRSHKN